MKTLILVIIISLVTNLHSQTLDDKIAEKHCLLSEGLSPNHPSIKSLDAVISVLKVLPSELTQNKKYMTLRQQQLDLSNALRWLSDEMKYKEDNIAIIALRDKIKEINKDISLYEIAVGKKWEVRVK